MKTGKKLLIGIVLVLMLMMCLAFGASAEDGMDKGYYYYVKNGEATITGSYLEGDLVVPEEVDGYPVTAIGSEAFMDNWMITGVTIGNNIESIGVRAFYRSGINKIIISDYVRKIGAAAFSYCSYYDNKLNWEEEALYIGKHLVDVNRGEEGSCIIDEFIIKEGTKTIAGSVFQGIKLNKVVIPGSIEYIGDRVFEYCTGLKSITLPDSVKELGEYVFAHCEELTDVTIGGGLTEIPTCAFWCCSKLRNVVVGEKVKTIGSNAFEYCIGLESIDLPDSVITLSEFKKSSLKDIKISANTKEIAENAFNSSKLEKIIIPDSVERIGTEAFWGCKSLTDVVIGSGITEIEQMTFYTCESLEYVSMSNSVTCIGDWSFYECTNLKNIILPDSILTIGDYAFEKSGLTSVTINGNITSIGTSCFQFCENLECITVESDNKYFSSEDGVLLNSDKTKIIQYPAGRKDAKYVIPNYVKVIGSHSFVGADNLVGVEIPDSVESIEWSAFSNCANLTSVVIPNSVSSLGSNLFDECTSLKSVVLPNSIIKISGYMFRGCSALNSIVIPKSVTEIGSYAFYKCNELKDVYYSGSEEDWKKIVIAAGNESLSTATVHYNNEQITVTDDTGVEASFSSGTFDENAELTVTQTAINANFAFGDMYDKYLPYNICFKVNGEKVQPNGTVTVKIPVPADFSAKDCVVYYLDINGNITKIPSRYENGYIIFETDHFSEYVLVDESSKIIDEPSDEPDAPDCSHLCHKSGFMGFIWKILRVFFKLFKANPVCQCGVAHY